MSRTDNALVAGVELGGTKCVMTLASGPGAIVAQASVPTLAPENTLPQIAAQLEAWQARHGFAALGIASFGPIELDPQSVRYGQMLNTPKPGWAGADVFSTIRGTLSVPFAIDTDVNGAALAETTWGAGVGLSDFAYVTVGTGVGVGLIVNGTPPRGFMHSEIGHLRVPRRADDIWPSGCPFHYDCVEGLAAGRGLAEALGAEALAAATPDHPIWNRVVDALATMAHALVVTTAPRRIVMGGGVINRQHHLLSRIDSALRTSLNGYVTLPLEAAYVTAPGLGDQAGPLGPIAMARALVV